MPLLPQAPSADNPGLDQHFAKDKRIQRIEILTYPGAEPGKSKPSSGMVYEYNAKGLLVKSLEIHREDTLRIHNFAYSGEGVLMWKHTQDLQINRRYRSGYRFDGSKHVFQVKSYEILSNNERMLMDTRQYIYDQDSLLSAIRWVENNRVIRVQRFRYDDLGRVSTELFEEGSGKLLRKVSYRYDRQYRVAYVKIEDQEVREYSYQYNAQGNPIRIDWNEGGAVQGVLSYEYDAQGRIARMSNTQSEGNRVASQYVQVYQYQVY